MGRIGAGGMGWKESCSWRWPGRKEKNDGPLVVTARHGAIKEPGLAQKILGAVPRRSALCRPMQGWAGLGWAEGEPECCHVTPTREHGRLQNMPRVEISRAAEASQGSGFVPLHFLTYFRTLLRGVRF